MAQLALKNIRKSFGNTKVLKDISLRVDDGEFVSLVGQSGCGKSTLLRIIAGLESPDSGDILIDGVSMLDRAPSQRNIAMVFQDYALYPHMSVAENMSMPLIMARLPLYARMPLLRYVAPAARRERPAIHAEIERVAKQLHIEHLLERRPAQLSGGQRQRVALGRALVRDPKIFLMDEPLSNLDAKLRVRVRTEISELHESSGLTFVYVTHDQVEAMTMSDRAALMQHGELLQVGAPNELYANPANLDVARFIGSPEVNIIEAASVDGGIKFGPEILPVRFEGGVFGKLKVGIRPESITVLDMPGLAFANNQPDGPKSIFNKRLVEDLGPEVLIHGTFDHEPETQVRIRAQKSGLYGKRGLLAGTSQLLVQLDPKLLLYFSENGNRLVPAFDQGLDLALPRAEAV